MLYAATISMERMNGTEAGDDGQGIFCNDKTRNDNCDFKTGILSGLQMRFNFFSYFSENDTWAPECPTAKIHV